MIGTAAGSRVAGGAHRSCGKNARPRSAGNHAITQAILPRQLLGGMLGHSFAVETDGAPGVSERRAACVHRPVACQSWMIALAF